MRQLFAVLFLVLQLPAQAEVFVVQPHRLVVLSRQKAQDLRMQGLRVEERKPFWILDRNSQEIPKHDPITSSSLWGLEATNSTKANELPNGSGEGSVVCIIDTGVDSNHPALAGRILGGINISGESDEKDIRDLNGHGTHVAGVIAGNEMGNFRGVAPKAQIFVVKIFDSHGISSSEKVAKAVSICSKNSKIINMSFGGVSSIIVADAIKNALAQGVRIIAASGNTGGDVVFPASLPGVIAISAVGRELRPYKFSNFSQKVQFFAPGVEIFGPVPGGYKSYSGTSMAAAFAAGAEAIRESRGSQEIFGRDVQNLQRPFLDVLATAKGLK